MLKKRFKSVFSIDTVVITNDGSYQSGWNDMVEMYEDDDMVEIQKKIDAICGQHTRLAVEQLRTKKYVISVKTMITDIYNKEIIDVYELNFNR